MRNERWTERETWPYWYVTSASRSLGMRSNQTTPMPCLHAFQLKYWVLLSCLLWYVDLQHTRPFLLVWIHFVTRSIITFINWSIDHRQGKNTPQSYIFDNFHWQCSPFLNIWDVFIFVLDIVYDFFSALQSVNRVHDSFVGLVSSWIALGMERGVEMLSTQTRCFLVSLIFSTSE